MVIRNRKSWRCMLQIGNIKKVQKINNLGSFFLTKDGECGTIIQEYIGLAKEVFQKLSKVPRNKKKIIRNKKRVISIFIWY